MEHFSFISAQTRLFLLLYGMLAESLSLAFAPLIFPCFLNTGFPACCTSCLLGQSNYYLSSLWKQCLHAFSKCQCLPVSRRKVCWFAAQCWGVQMHFPSLTGYRVGSFFINLLRLCKTQTITWAWTCTAHSVGREEQQSRSIFLCGGVGLEAIFTLWSCCQYF